MLVGQQSTLAAGYGAGDPRLLARALVIGNPARVVRRLEPGVGWVGTGGDVRPIHGGMAEPEAG